MSVETAPGLRQSDFSRGPNYTASPYHLEDGECAESEDVIWSRGLQAMPGWARASVGRTPSGDEQVEQLIEYRKSDGTIQNLAVVIAAGGATTRIDYASAGFTSAWTAVGSGLTNASHWDWATFNDVLILVSENNVPKTWDGSSFASLAGSPPSSASTIAIHGDFVLMTPSQSSQIRYSDVADETVWPSGNIINAGIDEGSKIFKLQRYGDRTLIFLADSIWALDGNTPDEFSLRPTQGTLGSRYPGSVIHTEAGVFFWSDSGPAVFDGVRTRSLGARLQRLLDICDWTNTSEFFAAYDPFRKLVAFTFKSTVTSSPMILLYDVQTGAFWPTTCVASILGQLNDSTGRNRIWAGTHDGYILQFDSGITYNAGALTPRVRTKYFQIGSIDRSLGIRRVVAAVAANGSAITLKAGVDGLTTLAAHGSGAQSTTAATATDIRVRWEGDGSGQYYAGHTWQGELSTTTGAFALHELALIAEDTTRR